mgnify:CR=1 FL=1
MKQLYYYLCCWVCVVSANVMAVSDHATQDLSIDIKQVAPGVWSHTSSYLYPNGVKFPSNGLIVQNGDTLTLIDTAWGEIKTQQLLIEIKKQINLPVSHAVVTHAHSDRAAGVDILEAQGIEVWAHPLTKKLTIEYGLPVPDHAFSELEKDGSQITFNNFQVLFPGAGHAMDNLVVWLPEQKILFGGCAVRAISAKSVGNVKHGDAHSWLAMTQQLVKQFPEAKLVVPGHGDVGGVELLSHTQSLLNVHLNNHALNKRL